MPRSDYVALIEALVRDDAGAISPAQRDDALALAVLRYAEDRPRPSGAAGAAAPVLDEGRDTIPPADREAVSRFLSLDRGINPIQDMSV